MLDSRMFDGALMAILFVGALLGIAFAGLAWLVYYLCHHIHIGWVS